jgi:hypothetical protein
LDVVFFCLLITPQLFELISNYLTSSVADLLIVAFTLICFYQTFQ